MSDFDFTIRGGKWKCQGWATNDPVVPKLGYGGHPVGARPKRKGLTIYEGRQPFQLEVPMLLWRGGESVERDREALENMGTSEGKFLEAGAPGVIIEAVFPLPIPPLLMRTSSLEWWIEDLAWKDEIRKPPQDAADGGHLSRKLVTVTLLEKVAEEFLGETGDSKGRSRSYRVKGVHRHGKFVPETLHEIAAHELGDSKRWQEIAKLNGIRSDGHLRVGQILKLPTSPHHAHKKAKPTTKRSR